ncbi:Mlp family lipoprotein [Borreliella bavariensis]|uniref:Mlp family lipoprotein n=1 Tax=Borreliella bavariensis TaxID=664662 RepID=UPI001C02F0C0|nr:Mlp family lipoprotein [Borreliella bavariensis]
MKIINILFWLLLITLNSCNSNNNETLNKNNMQREKSRQKRDLDKQGLQEEEKITLTAEEKTIFNSLVNAFKYTIEKLSDEIQGCQNGNKSKCTDFFDFLSKDIQKQKELASAFKKVYDFLKVKAKNEDFDTYIKGAIDCKATNKQNGCNHNNKYGNGSNEIEQYFRGITDQIFYKNGNEEIYNCLKEKLLDTSNNGHYNGLTTNWNT